MSNEKQMMMKPKFNLKYSLLLLLSFIAVATYAGGPGEIKGKVFDPTGLPLIGANVWVQIGERKVGTITDIDGKFTLKPLDAGYYNVTLSYVGFNSKIITKVKVSSDKITFLPDQKLAVHELEGPTVVSWKNKIINPEEPMALPITSKELERLPNTKNLATSIASMIPGVYQADDGQPLYFRGSRSSASAFFVDGVKSFGMDMGIPSSSVGEITVYTSGIPAKYGDVTGGVVVVETKGYFSVYNQLMMDRKRKQILGQ